MSERLKIIMELLQEYLEENPSALLIFTIDNSDIEGYENDAINLINTQSIEEFDVEMEVLRDSVYNEIGQMGKFWNSFSLN